MGGDSNSEGHGFKSRRRILDGHNIISQIFVVRIVICVDKKTKINEKEAEGGPFLKKENGKLNCGSIFTDGKSFFGSKVTNDKRRN